MFCACLSTTACNHCSCVSTAAHKHSDTVTQIHRHRKNYSRQCCHRTSVRAALSFLGAVSVQCFSCVVLTAGADDADVRQAAAKSAQAVVVVGTRQDDDERRPDRPSDRARPQDVHYAGQCQRCLPSGENLGRYPWCHSAKIIVRWNM